MIYLCNGRSASMMYDPRIKEIHEPLSEQEFIDLVIKSNPESAIGHYELAKCLSRLTGCKIKMNRRNLDLSVDDRVILVSLTERLPEHPKFVEYKNKLKFAYVRFEKQNFNDIKISEKEIKEIMEA